jgi:hypothetical protein
MMEKFKKGDKVNLKKFIQHLEADNSFNRSAHYKGIYTVVGYKNEKVKSISLLKDGLLQDFHESWIELDKSNLLSKFEKFYDKQI